MKKINSFTLIELLVVIIILGILAALAIPMYTNAIEQRKGEACANNIRTIMTAWRIYNMSHAALYSVSTDCTPATLNSTLGINIQENNFSANSGEATPRFKMQFVSSNQYTITVYRIGKSSRNSIICNYNPNSTTVNYVWSGDWPWISQIPQYDYKESL